MPESHGKRMSLHGFQTPKLRSSSSRNALGHHVPPKLSITMESPPLVCYGQPNSSTGALLSGQLKLYITEASMDVADFGMTFAFETTRKRPYHANCADCSRESKDLTNWSFLKVPTKLDKGEHCFPFSYLLKGDSPASLNGPLNKIQYNLHAVIISKEGEKITLDKTLEVKRAIFPAEHPKQSIRVFPPTNLTAHVELPSVIYPIGEYTATMRLDGIIKSEEGSNMQHHWKLKRMEWKLEETHKMISPACSKHAARTVAKSGDASKVSQQQSDVRTIGTGEMRSGWKSDYNSPAGSIDMEFPFSIQSNAGATCDIKAEDGSIEVHHQMIVELIVAEESAPIRKPQHSMPTGAARILRMQFNVIVTERSGLGISWDEEQPPTYEDVPESPPGYRMADIRDYTGSPLSDRPLSPVPDYEPLPQ